MWASHGTRQPLRINEIVSSPRLLPNQVAEDPVGFCVAHYMSQDSECNVAPGTPISERLLSFIHIDGFSSDPAVSSM
jgi:hypothetical protein